MLRVIAPHGTENGDLCWRYFQARYPRPRVRENRGASRNQDDSVATLARLE